MKNLVFTRSRLDAVADIFYRLEMQYGIASKHGVTFDLFIKRPDYNEQWINIYFANPGLFMHRPHGGVVHLRAFLSNGPNDVLLSILLVDADVSGLDPLPLLPVQILAVQRQQFYEQICIGFNLICNFIRDQHDRALCTENGVSVHDNRYIQPIKHKKPTAKWKSR